MASALAALGASLACLLLWGAAARAASPPVILEESTASVTSNSATLQAQINPEGSVTTYRFEYGTGTSYGTSTPVPDGSVGSGTSAASVQAHPQNLAPSTTYHYRVVAIVASKGETITGADETLTTQPPGGSLTPPDGRAWELVSPPTKYSGGLQPMNSDDAGGLIQGAEDGQAISYLATGPTETAPEGTRTPIYVQVLSKRGPAGWESKDITAPNTEVGNFANQGSEYRYFSPNLSLGLLRAETNTSLSPEATERTPYLRDNATGLYRPLVTAANVPAGTKFGSEPGEFNNPVELRGAAPDLRHVVLVSAGVALTEAPTFSAQYILYEWSEGHLQLVSVLPDGTTVTAELGSRNANMRHAISDDGSRVVWMTSSGSRGLYMRDTLKEETVQLDAAQGGTGESGGGEFQIASSDGSKVFFTDESRLTADSTSAPNEPDLYECEMVEVGGKLVCDLSDLTVDENAGEHANVSGLAVLGAGEDGSYVYFLASGALAPGAAPRQCAAAGAPAGEVCNLYVDHDGSTKLVGTPLYTDVELAMFRYGSELAKSTARVSPNGRYLAFMSAASLTGYDNRDANSGALDEEVYVYDAQAGKLTCVSCNPTGARPAGVRDQVNDVAEGQLLVDEQRDWNGYWLAGSIPPWIEDGSANSGEPQYQPRSLLDDGRVYFNSPDALVPQATNGLEDVYEYDPLGVGSCTSSSATFSAQSDGCVGLISAGTSGEESVFLDASASGEDVFFMTRAQLTTQDFDTEYDVYDAHVCSSSLPCPTSIALPPACTTADSCRAAPSPQPGVFGAPASATFSGTGNLPAPTGESVVKAKQPKRQAKPKRRAKHTKRRKRATKRGSRAKGAPGLKHGKGARSGSGRHKSKVKQSLSAKIGR